MGHAASKVERSSGYSSPPRPPTTYRLCNDGETFMSSSKYKTINMKPITKTENLQRYSLQATVRRVIAWCSFSPGYVRYHNIIKNIRELCSELYHPDDKFVMEFSSPVKPVGIRPQESLIKGAFRRFDVTVSIVRVRVGLRGSHDQNGETTAEKLGGEDGKSETAVLSVQEIDWRCFGARRLTDEVLMKAVEQVQKVLMERVAARKVDMGGPVT